MPRLSRLSLPTAFDDAPDDIRRATQSDIEFDMLHESCGHDSLDLCDEIADCGRAGWGRKVLGRALRMTIEQELWKRKGA